MSSENTTLTFLRSNPGPWSLPVGEFDTGVGVEGDGMSGYFVVTIVISTLLEKCIGSSDDVINLGLT